LAGSSDGGVNLSFGAKDAFYSGNTYGSVSIFYFVIYHWRHRQTIDYQIL
jgi:hypothetical protein